LGGDQVCGRTGVGGGGVSGSAGGFDAGGATAGGGHGPAGADAAPCGPDCDGAGWRAAGGGFAGGDGFFVLLLPVRPGGGCGVSAAGSWEAADRGDAPRCGRGDDTGSGGGSGGGGVLPANWDGAAAELLDDSAEGVIFSMRFECVSGF